MKDKATLRSSFFQAFPPALGNAEQEQPKTPLRVTTIDPDLSFVDVLADGLWRGCGEDPMALASAQIFLPTRRACRLMREAFLRTTGGNASLLPRLRPLGEVDEEDSVFQGREDFDLPPAMSTLRRNLLLLPLIQKKDPTLRTDQALDLAIALGTLIDQTRMEELSFDNLENLVPEEIATHWQETLQFLEIVTTAWPAILEEEGCLDAIDRRLILLDQETENWKNNPPQTPIIAAATTSMIPSVERFISTIAAMPQGLVILPGLDQQSDEEVWQAVEESHPQYGLKKWLTKNNLTREDVTPWPTRPETPRRIARTRLLTEAMRPAETAEGWRTLTPDEIPEEACHNLIFLEGKTSQDEAEIIALRLRAAMEEQGKTAALVTPDRALAERVASSLRRWGIEADDSAGDKLSSLPLGRLLDGTLRAADPEADALDYLSLLKHPLAACCTEPSQCRRWARFLEINLWRGLKRAKGWQGAVRNLQEQEADPRLIEWLEKIAEAMDEVTKNWTQEKPFEDHVAAHLKLAEFIAQTNEAEGSARLWRGEAGEAAATWFDDWREAAKDIPMLTGEAYEALYRKLIQSIIVRPLYGQHPRIDILGPLEARLWHPDLVILGGLNEGTWPPETKPDPWLSRPMRTKFGLPAPERRQGLSAHDFVQLASAPEVVLTRAHRSGTSPNVPSRFWLQTEIVLDALGYETDKAEEEKWVAWPRALDKPEKDGIKSCKPPEPKPPLAARPKKISLTDVSVWWQNPYAIYAKYVLKLRKLDDLDMDVGARDKGQIIHAALEQFSKQYSKTWPENPTQALLDIGNQLFQEFDDWPQVRAFWWPRFENSAAWFIAQENTRRALGHKNIAAECKGEITFQNGALTLRGRADRIDLLDGGALEIIDYKTGDPPTIKAITTGYEPQLPLIALMAEQGCFEGVAATPVAALSYWHLKGNQEGGKTTDVNKAIDSIIKNAQTGLEHLIHLFGKEETSYQAVPKPSMAPRYNDYAHLARLEEWGRAGEKS